MASKYASDEDSEYDDIEDHVEDSDEEEWNSKLVYRIFPTSEEIRERHETWENIFKKFSKCGDDKDEGMDMDQLLEVIEKGEEEGIDDNVPFAKEAVEEKVSDNRLMPFAESGEDFHAIYSQQALELMREVFKKLSDEAVVENEFLVFVRSKSTKKKVKVNESFFETPEWRNKTRTYEMTSETKSKESFKVPQSSSRMPSRSKRELFQDSPQGNARKKTQSLNDLMMMPPPTPGFQPYKLLTSMQNIMQRSRGRMNISMQVFNVTCDGDQSGLESGSFMNVAASETLKKKKGSRRSFSSPPVFQGAIKSKDHDKDSMLADNLSGLKLEDISDDSCSPLSSDDESFCNPAKFAKRCELKKLEYRKKKLAAKRQH